MSVWDYIIIGAGSAGCVLANRLSADPRSRVLLLEAGGRDADPWLHVPAGYFKTIFKPGLGWGYRTDPEPELEGRRILWPRGRVLGGTSSINGLIYIRGQREDYDQWRQLGASGWAWDDVLPYFLRAEGQAASNEPLDSLLHSGEGPLGVSDAPDRHVLCEAFLAGAEQSGIPRNPDFNGATQDGAGYYQITTRQGRRSSAAQAYLKPAMRRPNLRVITNALASRVLFDGRRAVGAAFMANGAARVEHASEIILCGGAINSPQLLQLSGVGPAEHLRATGIEVVHDLPDVGRNLQDHLQAQVVYRCKAPVTINDDLKSLWRKAGLLARYALRRSGPMASAPSPVGAFVTSGERAASPDLQLFMMPLSVARPGVLDTFSGYTFLMNPSRPESRGEIAIASSDPAMPPSIRPNYLSAAGDQVLMIEGVRALRRIAATRAFDPWREVEERPGEDVRNDDDILDYVRSTASTMYHPVGTCRMGADPSAVVDPCLRVNGLRGLRVVDASVMPALVSGNTNAPIIMIAEKASDMIMAEG